MKFWARARAGKRGGQSELHATLIKTAIKKVFMQTRPDGRSKKVTCGGRTEAAGECNKGGEVVLQRLDSSATVYLY